MKKLVHNVSIRVFEKDTKKLDEIKNVFNELLPVDFEKEKIDIIYEKAEGFGQKIIHIFSLKTSKRRHTHLLLDRIFSQMSQEDKKIMEEEKENRLDSEGNFYLRLDKNSLLNRKFNLTDSGDCFHFTIRLAAYPMQKENILESLDQLLKSKL